MAQRDNKLLLIKERYSKNDDYRWNIIKGSFEPEIDKNLIIAAKREAREEANARIKIKSLLNIRQRLVGDTFILHFNFIADLLSGKLSLLSKEKQQKLGEDIIEIRLFSKTELIKMKDKDFVGPWVQPAIKAWFKGEKYDYQLIKSI